MFWFSATLHLFSAGQVIRNDCNNDCCSYDLKLGKVNCDSCCGYSIHYTPHIGIAILFHFFGCYWATQFFIGCSSTIIAGSVASYYWARGEISVSISETYLWFVVKNCKYKIDLNFLRIFISFMALPTTTKPFSPKQVGVG